MFVVVGSAVIAPHHRVHTLCFARLPSAPMAQSWNDTWSVGTWSQWRWWSNDEESKWQDAKDDQSSAWSWDEAGSSSAASTDTSAKKKL